MEKQRENELHPSQEQFWGRHLSEHQAKFDALHMANGRDGLKFVADKHHDLILSHGQGLEVPLRSKQTFDVEYYGFLLVCGQRFWLLRGSFPLLSASPSAGKAESGKPHLLEKFPAPSHSKAELASLSKCCFGRVLSSEMSSKKKQQSQRGATGGTQKPPKAPAAPSEQKGECLYPHTW